MEFPLQFVDRQGDSAHEHPQSPMAIHRTDCSWTVLLVEVLTIQQETPVERAHRIHQNHCHARMATRY